LVFQEKVLGHEGLGPARPEESAQAAQQVMEDYEYVLHRGTLRSIVGLDKPAGVLVDHSIYEFAIHRLFASGSDRATERWREAYRIVGADRLELHHLYRAMAFLGEPLPQEPNTLGSPRCVKDRIAEVLFERRRDLFTQVDLVFFDTTSIYFEGQGGQTLGRHGHSKDHRPDLPQMIVGFALDSAGWPLCCELWPGNTTDVKTLLPVIERMKRRFRVRELCILADRGMISRKVLAELEAAQPPVR
jgi:hypothetical protein